MREKAGRGRDPEDLEGAGSPEKGEKKRRKEAHRDGKFLHSLSKANQVPVTSQERKCLPFGRLLGAGIGT